MVRKIYCVVLKCEAEGFELPYSYELCKRIYDSMSKETWRSGLRIRPC